MLYIFHVAPLLLLFSLHRPFYYTLTYILRTVPTSIIYKEIDCIDNVLFLWFPSARYLHYFHCIHTNSGHLEILFYYNRKLTFKKYLITTYTIFSYKYNKVFLLNWGIFIYQFVWKVLKRYIFTKLYLYIVHAI